MKKCLKIFLAFILPTIVSLSLAKDKNEKSNDSKTLSEVRQAIDAGNRQWS